VGLVAREGLHLHTLLYVQLRLSLVMLSSCNISVSLANVCATVRWPAMVERDPDFDVFYDVSVGSDFVCMHLLAGLPQYGGQL